MKMFNCWEYYPIWCCFYMSRWDQMYWYCSEAGQSRGAQYEYNDEREQDNYILSESHRDSQSQSWELSDCSICSRHQRDRNRDRDRDDFILIQLGDVAIRLTAEYQKFWVSFVSVLSSWLPRRSISRTFLNRLPLTSGEGRTTNKGLAACLKHNTNRMSNCIQCDCICVICWIQHEIVCKK